MFDFYKESSKSIINVCAKTNSEIENHNFASEESLHLNSCSNTKCSRVGSRFNNHSVAATNFRRSSHWNASKNTGVETIGGEINPTKEQ